MARRRKLELADLVDELWSLPPAAMNVAGQMIVEAFRSQGLAVSETSCDHTCDPSSLRTSRDRTVLGGFSGLAAATWSATPGPQDPTGAMADEASACWNHERETASP